MSNHSNHLNNKITIQSLMDCPILKKQKVIIKQLKPYKDRYLSSLTHDEWQRILHGKGMGDKKRDYLYQAINELTAQEGIPTVSSHQQENEIFQYIDTHPILKERKVYDILQPFKNQKRLEDILEPYQYQTLGELSNTTWLRIEQTRGFGKSKKHLIIQRLQELYQQLSEPIIGLSALMKQENIRFIVNEKLPHIEQYLPVPELYNVTFDELLEALHLQTHQSDIQSLLSYRVNEVLQLNNEPMLLLAKLYLAMLYQLTQLPLFIKTVLCNNERNQYVLNGRLIEKKTLEELGEHLQLTRERVRQIADKGIKEMNHFIQDYHYDDLVLLLLKYQFVISVDQYPVIEVMMKVKEWPPFAFLLNGTIMTTKGNEPLIRSFHHFMKTIKEKCDEAIGYSITRFWEEWANTEQTPYRTQFDQRINQHLSSVLSFYQLRLVNQWIVGTNWKRPKECTFLLKHFFKDGVHLNNDNERHQLLLQYHLFFEHHAPDYSEEIIRLFESYFDRAPQVVRVSSRAYRYQTEVDAALLKETYHYVSHLLTMMPVVTRQKLNHHFKSVLQQQHITDFQLYAAFKEQYHDDFVFSEGNVMRIFSHKTGALTTIDIFIRLLEQHQGRMKKSDILEWLGVEEYTINQTVSQSSRLFFNGDLVLLKDQSVLSKGLTEAIQQECQRWLDRYQFVSSILLFDTLYQYSEWKEEFDQQHIQATTFYPYLKAIFPHLEGHSYVLYLKGHKIESLYAILRYIGPKPSYEVEEIKEIGHQFGFGESSIYSYINKEIKHNRLYYIDKQQLIRPEQLQLTDEMRQQIQLVIKQLSHGHPYLAIEAIRDHEWAQLPKIDYAWTPCLLYHVMLDLGYVPVQDKQGHDYQPLIMKTRQSLTFKDILLEGLADFKGPYTEEALYSALIQHHFCLYRRDCRVPQLILQTLNIEVDHDGYLHDKS